MISPKLVYLSKSEARTMIRLLTELVRRLDATTMDQLADQTQHQIDYIAAVAMREKLEARLKGKK